MKKALSLLLAVIMLTAVFAACSDVKPEDTVSTTASVNPDNTTQAPVETVDPHTVPSEDLTKLDFTGNTIHIATTNEKTWEFKSEGETGAVINDAIFRRNALVADDLGVTLDVIEYKQSGGNSTALKEAVVAVNKSGDTDVIDVVSAPSYYTSAYVTDGLILDLEAIENSHINTNKIYWSSKYYENEKFAGKAYFLIGDLTPTVIERLEVIFLNDKLAETYLKGESKSLYSTVYDKEWTFEKFKTLVDSVGDGASTGMYGCNLPSNSYSLDGMEAGMGIKLVEKTDDNITCLLNDEHNIEIVETLRAFYYQNPSVLREHNENYTAFKAEKALFAAGLLLESNGFIAANIDYSLYPMPLWDENQEDYISTSQDVYSILSIPTCAAPRAEMITAVLEDLSYRSHDTVYTAMYEITYSTRYSDNYDESKMFDFIYQHVDFSFGAIYSYVLGEVKNCPRYLLYPENAGTNWTVKSAVASSLTTQNKIIGTSIKTFIKKFAE